MLKIAVLDQEEEYLRQLCAYMAAKRHSCLMLETYSEYEAFQLRESDRDYDGIVMSVSYWEGAGELRGDSRVILLSENGIPKEAEGIPTVLKYQAVGSMIVQISQVLQHRELGEDLWIQAVRGEVIGIYSPVRHEAQMLFSMTLAQMLGEDKKVLYLNFMESSGFSGIYQMDAKRGLSEVFYDVIHHKGSIACSLSSAVVTIGSVDCIPPVHNPEHLLEFTKDLYRSFFYELGILSGYDIIIADFGGMFPGFMEVLGECSSIYCIGKEGFISRCRMKEFEEYLEKQPDIAHKQHRLILPEELGFARGENLIHSGMYGPLGDFIRSAILGGMKSG